MPHDHVVPAEPAPIAVGVDGSPGSRSAVAWALAEAQRRGCGVSIWSVAEPGHGETADAAMGRARRQLHLTLDDQVAGDPAAPMCLTHVVLGPVVETLTSASATCSMLVLGSHGVGGLIHSAMGSVAEACIVSAACPVVLIPVTMAADPDRSSALVPAGR